MSECIICNLLGNLLPTPSIWSHTRYTADDKANDEKKTGICGKILRTDCITTEKVLLDENSFKSVQIVVCNSGEAWQNKTL